MDQASDPRPPAVDRSRRVPTRALGATALALALLAGSAACSGGTGHDTETATGASAAVGGPTSSPPDPEGPPERVGAHPRPTTQSVVIVGDSITHQSRDELHARLDRRAMALTIEATPRATAGWMLDQVAAADPGPVDQVIINVGTNDVIRSVPLSRTLVDIAGLIRSFPEARCIHLVTINRHMVSLTDSDLTRRTTTMNRALQFIADGWPEIHVIDWAGLLAEGSEAPLAERLLDGDTVHTNDFGQAVLADAYVAALDRCDDA